MGKTDPPVWLTWNPSSTMLRWPDHPADQPSVVLPLGVQSLAAACFKQTRPSPVELERAIDQVEDVLDGLGSVRSSHQLLATTDPTLLVLAHGHGHQIPSGVWLLTREQVEMLFQRLVSAALGHPSADAGLPADQAAYARLLLLREMMHHLHFDAVQVQPQDGAM